MHHHILSVVVLQCGLSDPTFHIFDGQKMCYCNRKSRVQKSFTFANNYISYFELKENKVVKKYSHKTKTK